MAKTGALLGIASVAFFGLLCIVLIFRTTDDGRSGDMIAALEIKIGSMDKELHSVRKRLEVLERKPDPVSGGTSAAEKKKLLAMAPSSKNAAGAAKPDASTVFLGSKTGARPLNIGTSVSSLQELYSEFAEDLITLKKKVMRWANETDLHQGIGDFEAEIIYLRLRKLRPSRVAELGFGQGLATRYLLQALEDNNHGHLYSFDIQDQWNRAPKMELTNRWTFTLGDGRKTLDKFAPYQYIQSDCEHSIDFSKFVGDWLKRHREPAPILFSFHDVYKWPPGSAEADCEGGMHRSSTGVTPEGEIMLEVARQLSTSPAKGSFNVAASHSPANYEAVDRIRISIGLDRNWVSDPDKYKDPAKYRKGNKKIHNLSPECKALLRKRRLQTMIYFEV